MAAAMLYRSPTRFKSVDMPAILALPKKSWRKWRGRIQENRIVLADINTVSKGKVLVKRKRSAGNLTVTHKEARRYNNEIRGMICQSSFLSILACSLALRLMVSVTPSRTLIEGFSLLMISMSVPTFRLLESNWGILATQSADELGVFISYLVFHVP